jgi:16S rRNA (guanine966-N2)-methyltransferase
MGTIRIIAGEFKGRRLKVPSGGKVRPTSDRVREALFSILGASVVGARVLDAYSGSGALGFEALSRGARSVVFVESDGAAADLLRENGSRIGAAERCRIIRASMIDLAANPPVGGPFDIIMADPPYGAGEAPELLALISAPTWLLPGGLIVLERERAVEPVKEAGHGFLLARTARYGRTCLDIYRRERESRDK